MGRKESNQTKKSNIEKYLQTAKNHENFSQHANSLSSKAWKWASKAFVQRIHLSENHTNFN